MIHIIDIHLRIVHVQILRGYIDDNGKSRKPRSRSNFYDYK